MYDAYGPAPYALGGVAGDHDVGGGGGDVGGLGQEGGGQIGVDAAGLDRGGGDGGDGDAAVDGLGEEGLGGGQAVLRASGATTDTDVTPKVVRVLESDPNLEVRFKAIPILRRLSSRDPAALAAIARAAELDADERVRLAAAAILRGERPRRWNQFRRATASRKAKASRRQEPSDAS